ncbi:hypothetical protein GWI33_001246 [Rhynchophorus ferrugineus]|uniref:GLTSCR protein conserved domain-containing protein n=1 Tax=Rhynchophorus ferrugineus TaxID=354439 RepID=A0A834MH03_RHYFE|nr:hypothetical protein GWI33_001246 [Rhynchophorus ferrugineus]
MSQAPNKSTQKMCKSPKSSNFQIKQEKIEYENISTNCTVVGSNNLNLVKKPQLVTSMSPAYSNPSPSYPQSPYSSPASLKSPSPSLKPPTPQPNYPVMQIIHNNLITRPIQTSQAQNIIKLKPHLNILPKPSASPQPSPKPSVSPQIVIPTANQQQQAATATLMPTAQPLLLNQMPMLTAPGVQFILRPQTAASMTAAAGPKIQASTQGPQSLILQPAGAAQQLLQLSAPARSQPMVRVLNGVQLAPSTTTYVTTQMANQPINATQIQQTIVNNTQQQQQQQLQVQQQIQQVSIKKKPKAKVKKKLDLANIMKLSGIGDEDDIQFESDTSQSESEHNSVPTTPQPQPHVQTSQIQAQTSFVQSDSKKNIQNIQISAVAQPTINTATPVVQVLNQNFQSGMISNSTSQAATAQAGIPFNSFITPNFTINNGLMLQRSGGFKLTVGEDGRLVLQHDPTLTQDIQSQLILQGILGLNGGLVLQPSMDQQTVQQTVQTIQQQSVQTIQQQTVQSQTIQTVQQQTVQPQVQHTIQSLQPQIQQQTVQQTIQHQTVNALQQPMQIVQPQPIHSLHSQVQPTVHSISQSQVHNLHSQIQSLLQQQNVAVQAQAVHQNVPQNVHSQAIQSVQNLTQNVTQNVQNLAQNSVQNVVTQNMQNLAQSSVQNMVAQNVVAAQNMASQQNSVVAQSMPQNTPVQNMTQAVPNMPNLQTVQSQPVQSPVHTVQGFQQAHTQTTQPILKVQPFQKSQPPVQTVQPIQHQSQQNLHDNHNQQQAQQNAPPTSYVVNLTPDQLEQLKRNGQLTVNGQTIFMQRANKDQSEKKLSPKTKTVKKSTEIHKIQGAKSLLQDNTNDTGRKTPQNPHDQLKPPQAQNVKPLCSPIGPMKHVLPQNHVQPIQSKPIQPQAMVQPSVQTHIKQEKQKSPISLPKQQKVSPTIHAMQDSNGGNTSHDVDKLLGQILEETGAPIGNSGNNHAMDNRQPQQRITTIQLTPQKQQHLKSIQMQIKSLSARLQPGDTEVHNALKALFAEQQKILASGKLLPPDKVYYHNNQLTIVNPSSLNLPSPSSVKSEPPSPVLSNSQNPIRSTSVETTTSNSHQPVTTQSHSTPRVSVSVSTSTGDLAAHSTIHHHAVHHQLGPSHGIQNNHQNVVVGHSNHVINQRLNPIGQISQLPPIYPKQPQLQPAQLQSPQLHSPQLHSPKLHSPQITPSSQLPSPQSTPQQQQQHISHHLQQHGQPSQNVQAAQLPKAARPTPPSPQQIKSQPHNFASPQIQVYHQTQHFHQPQAVQPIHHTHHNIQSHNYNDQLSVNHLTQQVHQVSSKPSTPHQLNQGAAQQQQLSLTKKAQLIESQLNLDQSGATKPDVHTPFRDKKDACIRLIRYHCMDQPVLSKKDLNKADEIFELTAQHFIGKFGKMVDKYKYLLMKESMRQVQTSELMMLDRMFLADEQQSLIRLRQDRETELLNMATESVHAAQGGVHGQFASQQEKAHCNSESNVQVNHVESTAEEEYDEWACIQRELGCLPEKNESMDPPSTTCQQQPQPEAVNAQPVHNNHHQNSQQMLQPPMQIVANPNSQKRSSSSDSRLETLKRFRVDKHTKKHDASVNSVQCINSNSNVNAQLKCGYENSASQVTSSFCAVASKEEESENNSIDEQVQSAINSILNLQQSTAHLQNNPLDLDSILS